MPRVIFASFKLGRLIARRRVVTSRAVPRLALPIRRSLSVPKESQSSRRACRRMFVDQRQLRSFVTVRIGAYGPERDETDERLRAIWVGVQDIRSPLPRCVESSLEGFHVVYGVSGQPTAPNDLSYTRKCLSWQPRQSALNGKF